ncbi:MAG: ATP-binding cassette domain-containing protein, partial [Firmicutes bacterium]|nr:ATP-binding cassette domain-containing protein [Bacillota bacterium]
MKHDKRIIDKSTEPSDLVLDVKDLTVTYKSSSVFGTKSVYTAVNHVNLSIKQGEIMGLVGESGCGKSTLSRAILGMLDDAEITGEIIHYTRRPQMVFQDPFSSLNPSKTVGWIMEEPLRIFGKYSEKERKARVLDMIDRVGLERAHVNRKPNELSGG